MTPETILAACPFCGGEATLNVFDDPQLEVVCGEGCGARISGRDAATVITAWNTRPSPQGDAVTVPREALDWKTLRRLGREHTNNGSGFSQIHEDSWRQFADAILALTAAPASPAASGGNAGENFVPTDDDLLVVLADDDEQCPKPECRGPLDTGWECNSCGYDAKWIVDRHTHLTMTGDRMHPSGLYFGEMAAALSNPHTLANGGEGVTDGEILNAALKDSVEVRAVLDRAPKAADAEQGEAIPAGVYYNAEGGNFYEAKSRMGLGIAFFQKWHPRRAEFPTDGMFATPSPDAGLVEAAFNAGWNAAGRIIEREGPMGFTPEARDIARTALASRGEGQPELDATAPPGAP